MLSKLLSSYLPVDLTEMRPTGFSQRRYTEIERCVGNVRSGKGTRRNKICPLCGSPDRKVLFSRFEINILQCQVCSVGYSEEFPVDSAEIYSASEYLPIAKTDYLQNVSYRKERFGKERLEIIGKFLDKSPDQARLLDIGCGTGWFIQCAEDVGYIAVGQEIGKDLAEFARETTGVQIFSTPITDLPPIATYDVVTMFDVLEHLPNPLEVLQHVLKLLNPGGVLLFFVPNLDSIGFKVLRDQSTLCMPVEHLFYFTEESVQFLLGKTGLRVKMLETKGLDVADLYSFYSDVRESKELAAFLEDIVNVLQPIIDRAGCGNHMRVLAHKPTEHVGQK